MKKNEHMEVKNSEKEIHKSKSSIPLDVASQGQQEIFEDRPCLDLSTFTRDFWASNYKSLTMEQLPKNTHTSFQLKELT